MAASASSLRFYPRVQKRDARSGSCEVISPSMKIFIERNTFLMHHKLPHVLSSGGEINESLLDQRWREGNAYVTSKTCLRSDLAKEWGDVRTVCGGCCRSKNIRKPKAVVGIEKWAGFPMRLLVDAEERQIGTVS